MKNQNFKFVFRCDGSLSIGLGHVMRCIALAEKCDEKKIPFHFLMRRDAELGLQLIKEYSWPVELLKPTEVTPSSYEYQQIKNFVEIQQATHLIVDHYDFNADVFTYWQKRSWKLIVIDDIGDRDLSGADCILNQNLDALKYTACYPQESEKWLGLNYCLIRNDFFPYRNRTHVDIHPPLKLLITMGGGDTRYWYHPIVQALLDYPQKLDIKVLTQFPANPLEFSHLNRYDHHLSFEAFTHHPSPIYTWADLVISAAGSTVWELCFLGVPMFLTDLATNQQGIAKAIANDVFYLGSWQPDIGKQVKKSLDQVFCKPEQLKHQSEQLKKWVDGQGGYRLIEKIMETSQ